MFAIGRMNSEMKPQEVGSETEANSRFNRDSGHCYGLCGDVFSVCDLATVRVDDGAGSRYHGWRDDGAGGGDTLCRRVSAGEQVIFLNQ